MKVLMQHWRLLICWLKGLRKHNPNVFHCINIDHAHISLAGWAPSTESWDRSTHTKVSPAISGDPFHLLRNKARPLCAAPLFLNFYWSIVSGVQQSEAVIHIYIYPFFFRFFSHIGLYSVLSRVACAIQ